MEFDGHRLVAQVGRIVQTREAAEGEAANEADETIRKASGQ